MARLALLVADLEGVCGVDRVPALVSGTDAYRKARELFTAEVNAAVEALLALGFDGVRLSDSHMSGSGEPNVLAGRLHRKAEPCFGGDAYAAELFGGASAVACLGMHPSASANAFAAHTVDLLDDWRQGGRSLSEAHLVLALAAEHRLPALFVSGDAALEQELGGAAPFVRTKVSESRSAARSILGGAAMPAALASALALPAAVPAEAPRSPLSLRLKSRRQADVAEGAGGARAGPYEVAFEGGSFRDRYARALAASAAVGEETSERVRGAPGDPRFAEDAEALLALCPPDPVAPRPSERLEDLRGAFLGATAGSGELSVLHRALWLSMLESLAPGAIARLSLSAALAEARSALGPVPLDVRPGVDPEVGIARLSASALLREPGPAARGGREYLGWLVDQGRPEEARIASALIGVRPPPSRGGDPAADRVAHLRWIAIGTFASTGWLRRPVDAPWRPRGDALLAAGEWIASRGQVEVAAELAICLAALGETAHPVAGALRKMISGAVGEGCAVLDAPAARVTGKALVALAAG